MKSITLLTFLFLLSSFTPLPGRKDNAQIYEVKLGKTKLFFYMIPEKERISRQFVEALENQMMLGIIYDTEYFPGPEIIPFATLFRTPIGEDINANPVFVDQKGTALFKNYTNNLKELAEHFLEVEFIHPFSGQNFVINFDVNRFHLDDVTELYKFLEQNPSDGQQYYITQDLTMMDWHMGEETFSSTIYQDPESEDRFMIPLFPKEVVGIFFAEPAVTQEAYTPPDYPTTLPPHTIVAPINYKSSVSPSLGRGKRTSVVVRGLTPAEEIHNLEKRCHSLSFSRPIPIDNESYHYPNGIVVKEVPDGFLLDTDSKQVLSFKEREGIEIFHLSSQANGATIKALRGLFNVPSSFHPLVRHLVKRGAGFTSLSHAMLDIPPDSLVICINESEVPEEYGYYNLSQDCTQNGLPWIHLYHLPSSRAMLIPSETFNSLSLTPIEEIIYRPHKIDIEGASKPALRRKICSKLTIFAFSPQGKEVFHAF